MIGDNVGLELKGTIYPPRDNIQVAREPSQASTGQIIGWTNTDSGTALLVQHYTGLVEGGRPFLVEPTLGQ